MWCLIKHSVIWVIWRNIETHTLGSIHTLWCIRNKSLIGRSYLRERRHMHVSIRNRSQRNEISTASVIPSLLMQMVWQGRGPCHNENLSHKDFDVYSLELSNNVKAVMRVRNFNKPKQACCIPFLWGLLRIGCLLRWTWGRVREVLCSRYLFAANMPVASLYHHLERYHFV